MRQYENIALMNTAFRRDTDPRLALATLRVRTLASNRHPKSISSDNTLWWYLTTGVPKTPTTLLFRDRARFRTPTMSSFTFYIRGLQIVFAGGPILLNQMIP